MVSPTRLARAPVASAIVLMVTLGGCTFVGSDDSDPYKASIGSDERTPQTDALGVALVVDGQGNGRVVGTLLNTTDRRHALVGADVDSERGSAQAAVIDKEITLPPGEPVELAREPAISVSAENLPVGFFVELTLDVEGGNPIEILVPVEAQKGPYAEIEVTVPPDGDITPS